MTSRGRGVIALLLVALGGCSAGEMRDGLYQGIYEGARIRQGKEKSPAERALEPDPDYNRYEMERREMIGKESKP